MPDRAGLDLRRASAWPVTIVTATRPCFFWKGAGCAIGAAGQPLD